MQGIHRVRLWLVAGVVFASAVIPLLAPARESVAWSPCSHAPRTGASPYNQHVGVNRGVGSVVGGAYVQIARYDTPFISVGGSEGSVVDYVMLKNGSGSQYTQLGFAYSGPGHPFPVQVFSETSNSSGGVDLRFGNAPSGSSVPRFTILYNYVPGRFTFQLNGSQWLPRGVSGGYNPSAVFTPVASEISAETIYYRDQMPGDSYSTVGHYDAHIYVGGWINYGGSTFTYSSSEYGIDPSPGNVPYYGTQFYVWDKRCPN